MPMSYTDYHRQYDRLIFGLAGMASAMLVAGGIRCHSNAWDDYDILSKYISFLLWVIGWCEGAGQTFSAGASY